ncbi:MAG TPA: glycosyltransferase, partial [Candidatus Acidoferrum sp.]|nr:glycosyltransferase [Candidatus Acidoferrum sp.]
MAASIKPSSPATPRLSVVVLVYNEAESIAPLHEELIGVLESMEVTYEVVYVDDGSRDGSTERLAQLTLNDPHVRVVSFRRNFGQTAAVQA